MRIAFFGLGAMGAPMALNLIRAGYEFTVFNRTPGKTAALAQAGASIARSAIEAAEGADVAITIPLGGLRAQSRVKPRVLAGQGGWWP